MSTQPQIEPLLICIRPMQELDLVPARAIFRRAFGTFLGAPDPETFGSDREYIFTRWRCSPDDALIAEVDGDIAGSNFVANWGSFGFFGPLTVRPDLWDRHIGKALLAETMKLFDQAGVQEAGLFTFAHSPKHIGLYQKFGFWPRFLTAIMSREPEDRKVSWVGYSSLSEVQRAEVLASCRDLTDSLYEGLDLTSEIRSVAAQNLGETVLLWNGDILDAFAICHCGAGTEGGAGTCYIKFGAVRLGPRSKDHFDHLLNACEALALERGLRRMEVGVNLNRSQAYRHLLQRGYRAQFQGVAMHKPDTPGYNRPDNFILDDWR
jgi:GNAT superfamily N-acetyltransferase